MPRSLTASARAALDPRARRRSWPAGIVSAGGGVALAGAAALANGLLARQAERRHPARGKFVDVDGVRLHYLEKGAGDTIVLIHGAGVTAEDYVISGLFDLLARDHRVIAFDRPGFGYSARPRSRIWTAKAQAQLLHAALKQLGSERSVVVGHSWGALAAMNMGLDHPSAVSALVLMSGYYAPTPRIDVPPQIGPALPIVGDLIRYTISPLLGRLVAPLVFKQLFSPAEVTDRFKSQFAISMALRPSQIRANASDTVLMIEEAAKTAGRHGELTLPVLIVSARGDKVVSSKHQSERLAREVPQSRLHLVEGAGHMLHHTAPQQVADAISDFLLKPGLGELPLVA